ncbi:Ubiquitin-related modifier 1 [Strongyloides ratti]|uniref:Ubiquitin-related modifier 1 homolog n=1 Tax=Strongyloides ratti TaxID=34506 RepID=A0A090LIH7_STRRB|nr:Ubiquitin-related modifier 1 [Strongyloides ratti]CEF69617.1 Ubiquitin-related modifier 1 [Strongyloides ratti]
MEVELQFGGGVEMIFNNQKSIKINLDNNKKWTVKDILEWLLENLMKDCETPEIFIVNGNVRPGILVLINDCDWEILDGVNTVINNNDVITFISTLHGG